MIGSNGSKWRPGCADYRHSTGGDDMEEPITGSVGNEREESNRKLVLGFYEHVIINREFDRWPEYLRPDYIQHKPNLIDGPQGVIDFMRENYARYPKHTPEVVRSFVDGDYVILHVRVHMEPFERDIAVMDIFRVADGKLAEHWDVDQPVPREMRHPHGMF
jgi:predicted SnoaL-like aldol condensation-catalyzing enzyme